MSDVGITVLNASARSFSGVNSTHMQVLQSIAADFHDHIPATIEAFYATLTFIPESHAFLEGRVEHLKDTLSGWLQRLFKGQFDDDYVAFLYKTGDIHVNVGLPVEYLVSGIGLIQQQLVAHAISLYHADKTKCQDIVTAVNASLCYSLFIMQSSYQSSKEKILEKFLAITGMSRPLFEKLAKSHSG